MLNLDNNYHLNMSRHLGATWIIIVPMFIEATCFIASFATVISSAITNFDLSLHSMASSVHCLYSHSTANSYWTNSFGSFHSSIWKIIIFIIILISYQRHHLMYYFMTTYLKVITSCVDYAISEFHLQHLRPLRHLLHLMHLSHLFHHHHHYIGHLPTHQYLIKKNAYILNVWIYFLLVIKIEHILFIIIKNVIIIS